MYGNNNNYYYPNYPNRYGQGQPNQQMNPIGEMPPQYIPPQTQFIKPSGLQGKQVDSVDVVRATDVPFDGSVTYFPLTDGSAIVTKQLQNDGTSKIVIFKPFDEQKEEIRYVTQDDLKNALSGLNLDELDDIKEDIKEIKNQLKKKEV